MQALDFGYNIRKNKGDCLHGMFAYTGYIRRTTSFKILAIQTDGFKLPKF